MSTEKQVRKRVRKNFKAQIDDLIQYCKINIEILESFSVPPMDVLPDAEYTSQRLRIETFKAVLKRLGVSE